MKLPQALLLIVILIGVGFSGYLTSGSIQGSCPIGGGCPEFLGYPACIYGFVMYIILLILFIGYWKGKNTLTYLTGISVIGMLFAGSLLIQEMLIQRPISVCAAGFIMYLLIFIFSLWTNTGKINTKTKQIAPKKVRRKKKR